MSAKLNPNRINTEIRPFLLSMATVWAVSYGHSQPTFIKQPSDQSVSVGADAVFSVSARGISPLSYQWRLGSFDLLLATNQMLSLTNLQNANAGNYSVVVTDASGSITSRLAVLDVDPTFTKIMTGDLVADAAEFFNVSWVDFDNSGYLDVFCGSTSGKTNYLYRNNGNGTFSRSPQVSIPPSMNHQHGAAWGDYDNDGFPDLFVTGGQNEPGAFGSFRNMLYHNNGDSTFTSITNGLFATELGQFHGCAWVDYDRDGFLDLFVSHHGASGGGGPAKNRLYHNNGDGTFTKITEGPVVNDPGDYLGRAWADYDNDGWPDLFVPNIGGPHHLYHNEGNGHFTEVTNTVLTADTLYAQHAAWADYDNDGYPDLFIAHEDFDKTNLSNALYHNEGNGTFTKILHGSIVEDLPPPMSPGGIAGTGFITCAWADYDNDGFIDLIVQAWVGDANGVSYLYHNNGDGTFTRQIRGSIVNDKGYYQDYAWGDYNRDGFLDLCVVQGAAWFLRYSTPITNRTALYLNNGNSNSWVDIKLVGTASNRSAIGAKVRAKAHYRGADRWQLREIFNGDGLGNQLNAHFGFGDATNIDMLRIEWPSGAVQELRDVAPRQFLTIYEPPRLVTANVNGTIELGVKGGRGFTYALEMSTNVQSWQPVESVLVTNINGLAYFTQPNSLELPVRFYRAVMR